MTEFLYLKKSFQFYTANEWGGGQNGYFFNFGYFLDQAWSELGSKCF